MKKCVLYEKKKMDNGEQKVYCHYYRAIRNKCQGNAIHCPHFQPTTLFSFFAKMLRKMD